MNIKLYLPLQLVFYPHAVPGNGADVLRRLEPRAAGNVCVGRREDVQGFIPRARYLCRGIA